MLMTILSTIILSSLAVSLLMFLTQIIESDFMNKEKREEFLLISNKAKEARSEIEQEIIDKTWHKYYMFKIRNISFKIALLTFPLVILLKYITKTWSEI